ncbi:MAG TPA: ribonuclease Z [Desulfobacterales bacterium]|nr:ribonuclease Z [Desulfobacterales bacterium]
MRPSFYPRLINGPFDDPGLYISFLFEKRALIFDLGDTCSLSAKDVLKISDVFITHTHMDHFAGFDSLLRLFLGREKNLCIFGPHGFLKNIEGRLAGYSWNLVKHYDHRFVIRAAEIRADCLIVKQYRCQNGFLPDPETIRQPFDGILLKEPAFCVSAVILDHSIPCLGFSMEERFHVNIMKDRLHNLGLEIGPWLKEFKQALFSRKDPDSDFEIKPGGKNEKIIKMKLGDLSSRIALITPGQKITYLADIGYNKANVEKVIELAKDSDHLFIESAFLDKHREIAEKKFHLTARQAGTLAAKAGVKQFTIFHFSPRYMGHENLLQKEAKEAYEETYGRMDRSAP